MKALAIHPFDGISTGMAAGVVAHGRIGGGGIHMGHLLPKIPRCPAHRVLDVVVVDHVAPVVAPAFRAKQFFQPFVAQHQHWVSVDNQLRLFGRDTALLQFLRLQQMQVVFFAVALNQLLRMGRAKQLTLS